MPRIRSNIRVPALVVAGIIAAAGASGCGGGSSESASTTTSSDGATVPKTVYGSFPAPVDTGNTQPSQPSRETPPSNSTPRSVLGSLPVPPAEIHAGAGRGAPASGAPAASATFVVRGGRLTPSRRTVPPMTPFALTLVAADGRRHVATLRARCGYALAAAPGRPGTVNVPGLARGSYALSSDRSRARLVVKHGG